MSEYYKDWYAKQKGRLSEKRRERYANDPTFRAELVEKARERRRKLRGESPKRPELVYDLQQASDLLKTSVSSLRFWMGKEYFPKPETHAGKFWLTESQVQLIAILVQYFDSKHSGKTIKTELEALVQAIHLNWSR